MRAPTPSAAAELVVPDKAALIENIRNYCYTAGQIVRDQLDGRRDSIRSVVRSYAFNRPLDQVRQQAQHLDELRRSLGTLTAHQVRFIAEQLRSMTHRISSLNPDAILRRGYAIVQREGITVNAAAMLNSGDSINIRFHDGECAAAVNGSGPNLFPTPDA